MGRGSLFLTQSHLVAKAPNVLTWFDRFLPEFHRFWQILGIPDFSEFSKSEKICPDSGQIFPEFFRILEILRNLEKSENSGKNLARFWTDFSRFLRILENLRNLENSEKFCQNSGKSVGGTFSNFFFWGGPILDIWTHFQRNF